MDPFHLRVDVVTNYRFNIGGSMSPSLDDFAYKIVGIWEGFGALSAKILVFPRPTIYVLISFRFFFAKLNNIL